MTVTELQQWLNTHGQTLVVDGQCGSKTREAIKAAFQNDCAPAVTDADIVILASRLGCTVKQLKAVSIVESGGKAFDDNGRPKMLFERHLFHRATDGEFTPSSFSQFKGGGYNENSWDRLTHAACANVDAAFASASWGKFQVLAKWWKLLEYPSPLEMAYSTVVSEVGSYEMLARYIEHNNLKKALQSLSANPKTNEAFAKGYNGPQYKQFAYDTKLAKAMT